MNIHELLECFTVRFHQIRLIGGCQNALVEDFVWQEHKTERIASKVSNFAHTTFVQLEDEVMWRVVGYQGRR